ncbi:MAG: (2Fe-2S) ferredoxin [Myxococcales bacterium]
MKTPWFEVSAREKRLFLGRRPAGPAHAALEGPDWAQASPWRIERSLRHAARLPSGGWYVVDASRAIRGDARSYVVAGQELVLWRDRGEVLVAPDACPHMGARLGGARVCEGRVVCPWHGLALGREGRGTWRPTVAHDDGVLVWVRLDDGEAPTEAPILAPRPSLAIDGVIRMEAACEPRDVIANRLDPWHGAWFHPYAFDRLVVTEASDTVLRLRVSFRVVGPVCVEVDCTFHCPDPRTVVMTIVDGDGVGSVVETHATPMGSGRTAIVEATLATSERAGFARVLPVAPAVRWFMERVARRLWVDDIGYAERAYDLRARSRDERPRAVRSM